MNYELAKELKDAGFPQGQHNLSCYDNGCYESIGQACVPSLAELIEACGEGFKVLCRKSKNEWIAQEVEEELRVVNGVGPTPEVAVARLWLALNKP